MCHRTDFEADLWPETRDFFGGLIYNVFGWLSDLSWLPNISAKQMVC